MIVVIVVALLWWTWWWGRAGWYPHQLRMAACSDRQLHNGQSWAPPSGCGGATGPLDAL